MNRSTQKSDCIYYDLIPSPIDELLLTSDGESLTGLFFHRREDEPKPGPNWKRDRARLENAREQLGAYFAGELTRFDLPIRFKGTAFQETVWRALEEIHYGRTVSYSAIAKRVGSPGAVRATGSAIGRNPVGIVIPCHRVIGSGGQLCGFGGGLDRKRWLLAHEEAVRKKGAAS